MTTIRAIANFRANVGSVPTPLTVDLLTTGARLTSQVSIVIPEDGVIDGVAVGALVSAPTNRGQTYLQFLLTRGGTSAQFSTLCAGYLFTGIAMGLGFIEPPGPAGGHGFTEVVDGANPAAGAEISDVLASVGLIRRLKAVSVSLAQGLTQTPRPSLVIDDGTTISAQIDIGAALAASTTVQLTWAIDLGSTGGNNINLGYLHAPLPPFDFITAGLTRVRTITTGIGANTDYGSPRYTFEDWVMPN